MSTAAAAGWSKNRASWTGEKPSGDGSSGGKPAASSSPTRRTSPDRGGLGQVERAELADGVDHLIEAPVAGQQEGADPGVVDGGGTVGVGTEGGDRGRTIAGEDRLDERHGRTVPSNLPTPRRSGRFGRAAATSRSSRVRSRPVGGSIPVPWSIRWFKVVAVAEAVSYLVLLGASVAKHVFDMPGGRADHGPDPRADLPRRTCGSPCWCASELGWRLTTTLMVVVAAVIPLGGLVRRAAGSGRRGPGRSDARRRRLAVSGSGAGAGCWSPRARSTRPWPAPPASG